MSKNGPNNRYIEKEKAKIKEKQRNALANKHISVGLGVYFLIFAYLIFIVLSFSFSEKTNYTMAEPGLIIESETFSGMIIKNEIVVTSNASGDIHYFIPEGEKVKKGTLVSCVDQNGIFDSALKALQNSGIQALTSIADNNQYLQLQLKAYVLNQNNSTFQTTYQTKDYLLKTVTGLNKTIEVNDENALVQMVNSLSGDGKELALDSGFYYAPKSGVVSYNFDGFENVNLENFTFDYLNEQVVQNDVSEVKSTLNGGQLYKIVDNYNWYIIAEINDICEKFLQDKNNVEIYIPSKNQLVKANISEIINQEAKTYVILKFDRYLNDFLGDRFLDFTINYFDIQGIKIPLSSVVSKEFLKIPIEALEEDARELIVKKKVIDEDAIGGESLNSIPIEKYYLKEDFAYIPITEQLKVGDSLNYILEDGTNIAFPITETEKLEGVYVINKGYADFRFIETLSFNEDYKIIKDTTDYGVNKFDRIATDASLLEENQIIK
ncbi:MAG: hypothetical protein H7X94_01665 [Vallitaleaceae bacterium]|nr:hypothetical protein [Vallitaleaceae bacterium]